LKLRCQGRVAAHQSLGAVTVALGLEQLIAMDGTQLADGTSPMAEALSRTWVGKRPSLAPENGRKP